LRILVTGSSGRIGGYLVKILCDHELLLIDKKTGFDLSQAPMDKLIEFNPEIIFHLAASFERTDETPQFLKINYADNILASVRLNQVLPKMKALKKFIFASSYLLYDRSLYMSEIPGSCIIKSLSENDIVSPRNLCGAAKNYIEEELNFISRNYNLNVVHARIFRVYGENGQEFISRCAQWKEMGLPVDLWRPGNRFDYIHAQDVAEALKHLAFTDSNGVYNVATGETHSIREVVENIGCKTREVLAPDELYENSCGNIDKIRALGWTPKISFDEGIRRVLGEK
jgi:UDP-glucose 4-epimerase